MGDTSVYEHLQTLRRWYKLKKREAPPAHPTCSSGALRLVGCFGCANSRLSSVIAQKQMCAKYRTLPPPHDGPATRSTSEVRERHHLFKNGIFRHLRRKILHRKRTLIAPGAINIFPMPVEVLFQCGGRDLPFPDQKFPEGAKTVERRSLRNPNSRTSGMRKTFPPMSGSPYPGVPNSSVHCSSR